MTTPDGKPTSWGKAMIVILSLAISFMVGSFSIVPAVILYAILDALHVRLPRLADQAIAIFFLLMAILVIISCFKKTYRYLKREGLSWLPYTKKDQ